MKKIILISLLSLMIVACNKDASAKEIPQNVDLPSVFSDDFEGFDEITDEANCTDNSGVWTAAGDIIIPAQDPVAADCYCSYNDYDYYPLENWDGTEYACSGEGCVYVAEVVAVAEVKASANVCDAPDYSAIYSQDDCSKAHGVWTDALGNEGEDGYMPARCFPWTDGE